MNPFLSFLKSKFHKISFDNQIIDQAVAMVFRVNPYKQVQLLFLQRAIRNGDHFSGDLCFPGGYREKGETCLENAMRETQQETGLMLKKSDCLGALDFLLKTKTGKSLIRGNSQQKIQLYMAIFLFQIQYNQSNNIKLQESEIRDYKWINFQELFLTGDVSKFRKMELSRKIGNDNIGISFPAYDIGMQKQLWGLTLYTTMFFLNSLERFKSPQQSFGFTFKKQFLDKFTQHSKTVITENEDHANFIRKNFIEDRISYLHSKL